MSIECGQKCIIWIPETLHESGVLTEKHMPNMIISEILIQSVTLKNYIIFEPIKKTFREDLIDNATGLFLAYTVKILVKTAAENGKAGNVNNWVRSATCEEVFLKTLRYEMASDFDLESNYQKFCEAFKV